jgi:phosphonopyruvate decarboxylase
MAMRRQDAIEVLAAARKGLVTVATMQSVRPWHETGQATTDHLDAMGCMGSASSLGLGIALARPERKVLVFDGDGSLLMQLGSLVTIASAAPKNYYLFVFENGVYETSGNQEIPALGKLDFCALALGAGFAKALSFDSRETLARGLSDVLASDGPVLIRLEIQREDEPIRWPKVRMADEVQALRAALAAHDTAPEPVAAHA